MALWDRLPAPPIRLPNPRGLSRYTVERDLPATMPDGAQWPGHE